MKKIILTSFLSFIALSMFAFTPLRFGAQIGVNSNKTDKDNGSDIYASKFDLGLNANIGIEIFNKAQVSLGYNVGTSEVNKEAKAQKAKNRTITLSIAYLF